MREKEYDVVIIGGGPAGMMAAGRAAERGARVVLLEKNASLGTKLLLTGGGRCNVTNAEFDRNIFAAKFKGAAKFLFSLFSRFGVEETLAFFHTRGMPTKVEAEKRVFPVSDQAQSVLDVLVEYMRVGNVHVMLGAEVAGFEMAEGMIAGVRRENGEVLRARAYVLATGGMSRPETGSTGDGFRFLKAIGHTVAESRVALVPIRVGESWIRSISGASLEEVRMTVFLSGEKKESREGALLFTHFGLSGPLALNMSRCVGECLRRGKVTLSLDLFPRSTFDEIDARIRELFERQKNKQVKNSLDGFLPPLLIPVVLSLANISFEMPVRNVSRTSRLVLVRTVKDLHLTAIGLLGKDKAIATSGGVIPEEVDFKTMRSRLFPNLYLAGDVLDIDRPSGGYSLQLCWSTGWVAGNAAAEK